MYLPFALASNKEIGQYLTQHIDQRFESHRKFCAKYIETDTGRPADSTEITNMSNRLSKILKGEKGIQLYDLPLFCRLLELSCEDILSAGRDCAPAPVRMTNYTVAFSQDPRDWEDHVNREDSPILNADEFGKTFIDYALEAKNYGLLKYLMDQGVIWFVGPESQNYFIGFGAGTSIEKKTFPYPENLNVLDTRMSMRDELRTQMVALAIQHEDLDLLEQLHAREIPSLYQLSAFSMTPTPCEQYYNPALMDALVCAGKPVLQYFSEEFVISDRGGFDNRFLFPFTGELIERLLQSKNTFSESLLEAAIRHNQSVYDRLDALLAGTVGFYKGLEYDLSNAAIKESLVKGILRDLDFYDNGDLVSYYPLLPKLKKGLRSNIIRVNARSADDAISRQIARLNELYDAIHAITPRFEGVND